MPQVVLLPARPPARPPAGLPALPASLSPRSSIQQTSAGAACPSSLARTAATSCGAATTQHQGWASTATSTSHSRPSLRLVRPLPASYCSWCSTPRQHAPSLIFFASRSGSYTITRVNSRRWQSTFRQQLGLQPSGNTLRHCLAVPGWGFKHCPSPTGIKWSCVTLKVIIARPRT